MSEFSKRLDQILKDRNMSQSELASKTGIYQSAISAYLRDEYSPKQDKISAIARALNVSPSYLMGVDSEKTLQVTPEIKQVVLNMLKLSQAEQRAILTTTEALLAVKDKDTEEEEPLPYAASSSVWDEGKEDEKLASLIKKWKKDEIGGNEE